MADVSVRDQTPSGRQESLGWFGDIRRRLFGSRDPVEAQLRDIARQGTFGAAISHFFATLLIILFSTASLIALGADSMRAVLASLAHGTVDIPTAVATGVTALLVPAMDVAMLRAASKIRLLATRRATRSEMALHVAVMSIISAIEAGTYCYMAAIYEHPAGGVAWALIIARAASAPLIGVYLAMDRPHPVTSRDILAQVELGAGAGVIRDVTEIANDASATLDRKMELFGASAVMRDHERERLNDLIAVAKKHSSGAALPPPRAIVRASYVAPEMEPQEHSLAADTYDRYDTYRAMHEGFEDTDYPITDELLDEVDEEDGDLFSTMKIPAVRLESALSGPTDTTASSHRTRTPRNSGPARSNSKRSASMREFNRKLKSEAKAKRRADIRDAVYAILDEWHAEGEVEQISDKELARRVAARVNFDVNPSGNTVARWRGPWRSSRTHKAEVEREAQEQDSVSIVADDIVAMLEQEREEALV